MKPEKKVYEAPTLAFVGQYSMLVGGSVIRVPIQLGIAEGELQ
jgi:hypothetical protein